MAGQIDLVSASLRDVVKALEDGRVTSVSLVEAYLAQIAEHNINGLGLRAVIETAPLTHVLMIARDLDEQRRNGKTKSTLHGVPVIVKDSIATDPSMGMQTTGGLIAFEDSIVPGNAEVVDRLVGAGVIILGKANLTVLGNYYSHNTSNGWSPKGGQTGSAYLRDSDPSGSSSGSAVSLSAGFCAASVGGETMGSIICPARRAGLYALKPTLGLVSAKGTIGISPRMDGIGPMGKTTWDIAAMLEQMVVDPQSYTQYAQSPYTDITRYRLGLARKWFEADRSLACTYTEQHRKEARDIFDAVINKLGRSVVMDNADVPGVEELWGEGEPGGWQDSPASWILKIDFYECFNEWVKGLKNCKIRNLEDLVQWNEQHPDQAYSIPGGPPQDTLLREAIQHTGKPHAKYEAAVQTLHKISKAIEAFFVENDLDAMIFAAGLGAFNAYSSVMASSGGFPIATMPVGQLSNGEPYAIVLMGRRGLEATLLGITAACERLVGIHPIPTLLKSP